MKIPTSKISKKQTRQFVATWPDFSARAGSVFQLIVKLRFDDECKNGHNTFAMTGDLSVDGTEYSAGVMHDTIAIRIPELRRLVKWHLTSTDGPMHYIANTLYHAKDGSLEGAQKSAIWPGATLNQLRNEALLLERLPSLLGTFKVDMEALGFEY